ncbi:MAG: hypothetical protein KJ799_03440 [Bacteroidetes bacterium]|nr:hypothetical protein [Bacteroidota bacterium]
MLNTDKYRFWISIRKMLPGIALIMLTIALMIFFKLNEDGYQNLQSEAVDLVSAYTQNLKPISERTELTNEDIFNFALYKNIPIDKEQNRALRIENDLGGNESVVVEPIIYKSGTRNYDSFLQKINASNEDKRILDSAIGSYKKRIDYALLLNEDNTVAIKADLRLIQKALSADIYELGSKVSGLQSSNYSSNESGKSNKIKEQIALSEKKDFINYIVIAEDTILNIQCTTNESDLKQGITKTPVKIKQIPIPAMEHLTYTMDNKSAKVWLPAMDFKLHALPKYDSLILALESKTKPSKGLNINFGSDGEKSFKMSINSHELDSAVNFAFELNLEGLEKLSEKSIGGLTEKRIEEWADFGAKIDSLSNVFHISAGDTSIKVEFKNLTDQIKKFKKDKSK